MRLMCVACASTLPSWRSMPVSDLRTDLSSAPLGDQNSSTTTLWSASACSTRSGSPPAAAASSVRRPGSTLGVSSTGATGVTGVTGVTDGVVAAALLACSTALPGAEPASVPPAETGGVVAVAAGVAVAATGVPSSAFGLRNSIHATRKATAQTSTIRIGGEICDIPLPLSAVVGCGLSPIDATRAARPVG
jgi:hypothetical protein